LIVIVIGYVRVKKIVSIIAKYDLLKLYKII